MGSASRKYGQLMRVSPASGNILFRVFAAIIVFEIVEFLQEIANKYATYTIGVRGELAGVRGRRRGKEREWGSV